MELLFNGGVNKNILEFSERFIMITGVEPGKSEIQPHFAVHGTEDGRPLKRFKCIIKKTVQRQAITQMEPCFRIKRRDLFKTTGYSKRFKLKPLFIILTDSVKKILRIKHGIKTIKVGLFSS